jgi:hypothetical protein
MIFTQLTKPEKIAVFEKTGKGLKLDPVIIEKDWWVTAVLRIFVGLKGFDYDTLATKTINIIPPANSIEDWKTDYETMQNTMIYGNSLPFNELIDKIKQLNERISQQQ